MYFLTNLKQLWKRDMEKLSKLGFTAGEIAQMLIAAKTVASTDKLSKVSTFKAKEDFEYLWSKFGQKLSSNSNIIKAMTDIFGFTLKVCCLHGGYWPSELLVTLPDDKLCCNKYLFDNAFGWEYSSEGTIVRKDMLYGDKNILPYNADPLHYLKFKCLPTEKLAYDTAQDEDIESDYNGFSPVFLGVELEVEKTDKTPPKIEHLVAADLGMDFVILKHDGSLTNGFEVVSAPATLGFHLQAWDKFFDNSAKLVTSWASGHCGMHVHISRKALTPMHLANLNAFLNNGENRAFITTIAGRTSTYSKFNEGKGFHVKSKLISTLSRLTKELQNTDIQSVKTNLAKQIDDVRATLKNTAGSGKLFLLSDIEHGGEKYSALNLLKQATVEVRIFRGNVSKIGMLKNIEFVHAAVEFCREATFMTRPLDDKEKEERKLKRKENTDYSLHYEFFLDWLEKNNTGNYNNLKLWLQTHKLTDKFIKRKLSSKTPPNKNVSDDDVRAVA